MLGKHLHCNLLLQQESHTPMRATPFRLSHNLHGWDRTYLEEKQSARRQGDAVRSGQYLEWYAILVPLNCGRGRALCLAIKRCGLVSRHGRIYGMLHYSRRM